MIPIRSTSTKENCSPTSSNCVIWQGPDIPCLSLCKGDSISDVTYKLATELCGLITNMGVDGVDLTTIVTTCSTTPTPVKTVTNIFNLLIDKIICINTRIDDLPPILPPTVLPTFDFTNYACLSAGLITIPTAADLETTVLTIATKLCDLKDEVDNLSQQVTLNTSDIATIQTTYYNEMSDLPQVTNCFTGTTGNIDDILEEVANTVCDYADVLGTTQDITDVQNAQCTDLTTAKRLSGNTTYPMSSLTINGITWNTTVTNVAESLQNLWLTVCDIRAAVKLIQESCCKVSCEDIVVDFTYKWVTEDKNVSLVLYFLPRTNVPAGFYDCGDTGPANVGPGNIFTVTDANGNEYEIPVGIHFRFKDTQMVTGAIMTDPTYQVNGYSIDMTNPNSVDIATQLTITSNVCFTDGTNTCIKCVNKVIGAYVDPTASAPTCCTITANAPVSIMYKTCTSTE